MVAEPEKYGLANFRGAAAVAGERASHLNNEGRAGIDLSLKPVAGSFSSLENVDTLNRSPIQSSPVAES